jgi:hypothetical protein
MERSMNDVFTPMTAAEKAQQNRDYLAHVKQRDGFPDVHRRTLAKREEFYEEYRKNPLLYEGEVPRDEFWKIYRSRSKEAKKSSSKMALWMAILARVNTGEKYGVELGMSRYETEQPDLENPMTYLEMEEFYHTHMLGDALKVLNVDVTIEEPHGMMKPFVWFIARLPKFFSYPITLMAEVMATVLFVELWLTAKQFFANKGEAGRRIIWLVEQILIDEVGHVSFVQAQMGPIRLWLTKKLMPLAAPVLLGEDKSIGALYDLNELSQKAFHFNWELLPAEIRAKAFVPTTAKRASEAVAAAA